VHRPGLLLELQLAPFHFQPLGEFLFALQLCWFPLLISTVAFGFGAPGLQAANFLTLFGALDRLGGFFILASVREFAPFVTAVGLFVDASEAEIRETITVAPVGLLQFHGGETPDFCSRFGLPYIKAVRVRADTDLLQYARDFHDAKALLLDAYVEGTHGGTGRSFDWSVIPRTLTLPVVLSGGLDARNVAGAIQQVRPWAVDVSSGVEAAPGIKDAAKIAAFIAGVRNADV